MTTTAQQMLNEYIDAEKAVLAGRTVTIGGRTLTMVDLIQIREGRQEWERRVNAERTVAQGGNPGYSLASF